MKGTFKKYDEKKEKLIILICLKWKVLMFFMLFNLWSRFLFSFLIRLDYYHRLYYLLFAKSQDELLFQLTRCHLIIHKGYQEKIWFFPSFALVIYGVDADRHSVYLSNSSRLLSSSILSTFCYESRRVTISINSMSSDYS